MQKSLLIIGVFLFPLNFLFAKENISSLEINFSTCNNQIKEYSYPHYKIYNISILNEAGNTLYNNYRIRLKDTIKINNLNYGKYILHYDNICENPSSFEFTASSKTTNFNICIDENAIKNEGEMLLDFNKNQNTSILYIRAGLIITDVELIEIKPIKNNKFQIKTYTIKKQHKISNIKFKEPIKKRHFKLKHKTYLSNTKDIQYLLKQLNIVNCISSCSASDIYHIYKNNNFVLELMDSTCKLRLWQELIKSITK